MFPNEKSVSSFFMKSIPKGVVAIGISSLFINISTSAVFATAALYMRTFLGVQIAMIGLIEAMAEFVSYAIRLFSGYISDYSRKRKSIIIVGFILVAISKPFFAFSKSYGAVFMAKTIDRIGNGIQASPRDALIGDLAPHESKGSCYGLRQSMSTIGAILGGITGIIVLRLSNNNFKLLFLLLTIPALISIFVILFFVNDKKNEDVDTTKNSRKIKLSDLRSLGSRFWMLMLVVFVFMLGRFSEVFIVLHANSTHHLDVSYGTIITVIFNISATLIAFPIGKLSDKIERTNTLLLGLMCLLASHIIIYSAPNLNVIFLGTLVRGLQFGINQSIVSTLVADYVPKGLRGTGFGVYYSISAVATAVANSFVAGYVTQKSNSESTSFLYGAILCLCSIIILLALRKKMKTKIPPVQQS
jgi:MFS family permease